MYSKSNDSLIHEKEVVNIRGVLNAVKCHLVKDWRSHHQSLFSSVMHHKFRCAKFWWSGFTLCITWSLAIVYGKNSWPVEMGEKLPPLSIIWMFLLSCGCISRCCGTHMIPSARLEIKQRMCFCGKSLKISAGITCCFNIDNWRDWRQGCQVGLQQGKAMGALFLGPVPSCLSSSLLPSSFVVCQSSFTWRRRIIENACVVLFSCFLSCWWIHFPRSVPLRQSNIKMAFAESWGVINLKETQSKEAPQWSFTCEYLCTVSGRWTAMTRWCGSCGTRTCSRPAAVAACMPATITVCKEKLNYSGLHVYNIFVRDHDLCVANRCVHVATAGSLHLQW